MHNVAKYKLNNVQWYTHIHTPEYANTNTPGVNIPSSKNMGER
jgi:hypothetical protein